MTTPTAHRGLHVAAVRDHFPSLRAEIDGRPVAYLDGPGGTQVPRQCITAMSNYLETSNANTGGSFGASRKTDAVLAEAHAAAADFIGAHDPAEIVFGPNMTTLTFALSRAIGRELRGGDELVVTRLDHDANVAPWLALAEERGAVIRWLDFRPEDCTLDLAQLDTLVSPRTRLVAITLASNAVGTVVDVGRAVEVAHAAGALCFVDAVHAAPHLPLDVSALRADFLACSPYKFFGPHLGILYGRRQHLERLRAFRVRPVGEALPGKWETGTQSHEALAGLLGTFDYLVQLGRAYGRASESGSRRDAFRAAMSEIRAYERSLIPPLLEGIGSVPGVRIYGIAEPDRSAQRVPTVAFTMARRRPQEIADHLAERGISAWAGNYYALEVIRRLGLEDSGGMLRIGLVHYNTRDEIERLVEALGELG